MGFAFTTPLEMMGLIYPNLTRGNCQSHTGRDKMSVSDYREGIAMDGRFSGLLFILVGPGGVGKNALMQTVLPRFEHLRQLPTATTRAPREGEQHGRERLFVSLEEFKRMMANGELVEHEEVHPGKFYGVPRCTVEDALREGEDLIADIEVAGAAKVHTAYPDNTVLIFIAPPSLDVLSQRMRNRGESEAGIAERIARAEHEMDFLSKSEHIIINDQFERASAELYDVICRERAERDQKVRELMHA
jgi:guanylate kinase